MSSVFQSRGRTWLRVAAAGLLAFGASQSMAASVTLCVEPYTLDLPGAAGVPMWGYREVADASACSSISALRPSAAVPVITVPAADATLAITIVNRLNVPTSVVLAGQDLPTDGGAPVHATDVVDPAGGSTVCAGPTAADLSCRVRSFTGETAPGATRTYTFGSAARPLRAGTYLYQSGTHPQVQIQMGLAGLLRKDATPSVGSLSGKFLFSNPDWVYDVDVPVVLSEVDDAMHGRIATTLGSATPATWQANKNSTFDYNPRFFLINGRPYDGAGATDLPVTTYNGAYVVLRMANAGLKSRNLVLNNGHWQVLTEDGNTYPAAREQYSLLLPAGKTSDAQIVAKVPATVGTVDASLALFDRRGGTDNADTAALGGQVARLAMSAGDPASPLADLSITKTDGATTVFVGDAISYTITVGNAGPSAATGAAVVDALPAGLTGASWTCSAGAGSSCGAASGTGGINSTVNLPIGGSATFTLNATVGGIARSLVNTATITPPEGVTDRRPANNSASDTDVVTIRSADLSISKTHNKDVVVAGTAIQYTIVVSNPATSNSAATGATVTDGLPAALTAASWTCSATAGSSCAASGSGNISASPVNLAIGGSATYTLNATVAAGTASGTLSNTASLAAPGNVTDPNLANNTATDTVTVVGFPALAVLDTFDRTNANTLNTATTTNWSQVVVLANAAIRVNTNQAFCSNVGGVLAPCVLGGAAYWNAPVTGFGARQAAAMTFANTTVNGDAIVLKASGGTANVPASFARVRATGTQVIVETTTNSGVTYTPQGTPIALALVSADRLTAMVDATGAVYVWKNGTFAGTVTLPNLPAWTTGTGRIGIQLPSGARIDSFAGGSVAP
jgi:uncharacterized repeat protein (TIGR01451 family)